MKVLLNALQAGNRSGTGRYTEELVRHLMGQQGDIEVHVAWPASEPKGFAPPEFCHRIAVQGAGARLRFDQWGIHRLARRLGTGLIHYPANIGSLWGRTLSIVTVHDLSFFRNADWFRRERALYYRAATRWSVRRAAHLLADSQATANDLTAFLGVPGERIVVVPLGVDPCFTPTPDARDEALKERMQLPARFLLYVGTLEPRKNLPRLIEAYDRIAGDIPHDLVIAGRDGWKAAPIHAALAAARHRARIHLPGFVPGEDLPALLRLADGFVFPSLCEGFGLPPLEAMACGTPVLTSNAGSLPEVTGDAALLVEPQSMEAIAEGMRTLATDETLCAALAERGLARVPEFTWRRCADRTLAIYRRTLAGR